MAVEDIAATDPHFGKVGLYRQRLVIGREGLVMALEAIVEDAAATNPRFNMVGLYRQRYVIAC